MSQKRHLQISLRSLQVPSELFFELTRYRTLELDLERAALSNFQGFLLNRELKHFGKCSFWLLKSKMARNLASVFNLDRLLYWLINEDVSKIDLLLSEISFRSQSFTF